MACIVIKAGDFVSQRLPSETAGKTTYYAPVDLTSFVRKYAHGPELSGRVIRIEVRDVDGPMHGHPGFGIGVVAMGSGHLKTQDGNLRLEERDIFIIPPEELHLAVADPGTIMVEYTVYLGDHTDNQRRS